MDCEEIETKSLMAYNFPAVLYIYGSMNDQLFKIFNFLYHDSNPEIKRVIAKQIGDVCRLRNSKESELMDIVNTLIEDKKTFVILIDQFFVLAKSLKNYEFFLELLMKFLPQFEN